MVLVKWNKPMISGLMNHFLNEDNKSDRICYKPATNIRDNEKSLEIEMAVPGRNKKDFDVKIEKNILTVSYENGKEEDKEYKVNEFNKGSFCRSFALPEEININDIEARYENGILNLTLPRREEAYIKREIEIS